MAAAVPDKPSTRERILGAALDAFAARGVEATSLDAVGADLGIRKQTILYWFPSKEQLLLGVVDHAIDELGRVLSEAAVTARPSPTARGVARGVGPVPPVSERQRAGSPVSERQLETPVSERQLETPVSEPQLETPVSERQPQPVGELAPMVVVAPTLADRLTAVVDATFRLGTTRPQLLAFVREVTRLGPPASTHLATAVEPLVDTAATALGRPEAREQIRAALLAAGARVVGLATEAEVRADLGLAPDLPWLRRSRRELLDRLRDSLG